MAGDQEQVAGRDDLVLGELVAGLLDVDQTQTSGRHPDRERRRGDQVPADSRAGQSPAWRRPSKPSGADHRSRVMNGSSAWASSAEARLNLGSSPQPARAGSPPARLPICTSATGGLPRWHGCSPVPPVDVSSCASTISTTARTPTSRPASSTISPRSASAGTGHPSWQTEHPHRYNDAVDGLAERGLLYECYCSRRDIQQAPRAPHAPEGAYPGTCRDLTNAQRSARRDENGSATGAATTGRCGLLHRPRSAARLLHRDRRRLRGPPRRRCPRLQPRGRGGRRDPVRRQVVRGYDLPASSPRQAYFANLMGHPEPTYANATLVLNEEGTRLAKRDGAVTLAEIGMPRALEQIGESLGLRCDDPGRDARGVRPEQVAARPVGLPAVRSCPPWHFGMSSQRQRRLRPPCRPRHLCFPHVDGQQPLRFLGPATPTSSTAPDADGR